MAGGRPPTPRPQYAIPRPAFSPLGTQDGGPQELEAEKVGGGEENSSSQPQARLERGFKQSASPTGRRPVGIPRLHSGPSSGQSTLSAEVASRPL